MEESEKIRVVGTSESPQFRKYGVTLENLTEEEWKRLQGALKFEQGWVSIQEGRLQFHPSYEELPLPAVDEKMLPFWRMATEEEVAAPQQFSIHQFASRNPEKWPPFSPHIMIQHLCGYAYTPGRYKFEAEKLESYGFQCMRSRRGATGQFWEAWYLPGLFAATGALREAIGKPEDIDKAVEFLCRAVSFGSLDVAVQRAAMMAD